jgi:hypothetical protein
MVGSIDVTGQDLTEAIRQRAYEIWVSEGYPHGRDHIHWLRAEAEFREKFAAAHSGNFCKVGLHERPPETRSRALDLSAAEEAGRKCLTAQRGARK